MIEIGVELGLLFVTELEELSFITKQVSLNERVNPIWLPLIYLLVEQGRLQSHRFCTKLILDEHLLSMVEQEVEWAKILYLLVQVSDAVFMDRVIFVTQMRVQVVAWSDNEFNPLILIVLLVAVQ